MTSSHQTGLTTASDGEGGSERSDCARHAARVQAHHVEVSFHDDARLIGAQRDRVIASYTLLSAIGRLDVKTLGLNTPDYLPEVHYHQVRDAWHGLRTPSGQ